MLSTAIRDIKARQVLDFKSKPSLEVDILTEGGALGRASSPSGVTVGEHEVFVLRDGDKNHYDGAGVLKAVEAARDIIAPALIGVDVFDQKKIDRIMIDLDGTANKSKLGGNTIFSVSLACARAAAATLGMPLYQYLAKDHKITSIALPSFGYFFGGSYQKETMPFQEITMIAYKVKSVAEAVEIGVNVMWELHRTLRKKTGSDPVLGSLAGWVAPTADPAECFDMVYEAAARVGAKDKIGFHIDCASSENYIEERGTYDFVNREITSDEMIAYVKKLTEKYNFLYIEDILDQNDWDGWKKASREITRAILIGDDFIATNRGRLKRAYEEKAAMGFIFKPNQAGTMTESMETFEYASEHGMIAIPSPRAGGVLEDVVFDLAIGLGCPSVKQALPRSTCVYGTNYLLRAADLFPHAKPFDMSGIAKF